MSIVSSVILFAGAGFSKDFGGYLSREMNAFIRNECPQELRDWIDGRSAEENFEDWYAGAVKSNDSELERELRRAIEKVFDGMDQQIKDRLEVPPAHAKVTRYHAPEVFRLFVSRFIGSKPGKRSFFFTVNQDLLVERAFVAGSETEVNIRAWGLHHQDWFHFQRARHKDPQELSIRLPDDVDESEPADSTIPPHFGTGINLAYIKLHGSINWRSRNGNLLVIGDRKADQIKREPLLRWYSHLFDQVLRLPERRVVVVGYGFGDPHVNATIASAADECGLRLYVVSPGTLSELLDGKPHGAQLKPFVEYHHAGHLVDLYEEQHGLSRYGEDLLGRVGLF